MPPNAEKNEQYKDTLIWEAALELSSEFEVVLVTSDHGFYSNRDPAKGLAAELRRELDLADRQITVVSDLRGAAELLRVTEPPVDVAAVVAAVDDVILESVRSAAAARTLSLVNSLTLRFACLRPKTRTSWP